jgi:hypothetical protein
VKQHTHQVRDGKPEIVSKTVSREVRGADSWTEATVRTGPLKRVAGALLNKIGDR